MNAVKADPVGAPIVEAIQKGATIEMTYGAGAAPRRIRPHGLVRSLDGDFVMAFDDGGDRAKRFFADKITSARIVD